MIKVLLADDQALVRTGFRMILENAPDMRVVGEAADGEQAARAALETGPDVVLMDVRMPEVDGVEATRRICAGDGDGRIRVLILTTFDLDEYVYAALRAGASGFLLKDTLAPDLLSAIRVVVRGEAVVAPSVTRRLLDRYVPVGERPGGVVPGVRGSGAGPGPRSAGSGVSGVSGDAGSGPAGAGSAGLRPAGLGSAGLGPAGLGSAGLGPAGPGPVGLGPAGVGSAGVGSAGVGSAGWGSAGPGAVGAGAEMEALTEREREVLGLMARGLSNSEIAGRLYLSEGTVKTHVSRVLGKLALRDRVQAVVYAYESGLIRAGLLGEPW